MVSPKLQPPGIAVGKTDGTELVVTELVDTELVGIEPDGAELFGAELVRTELVVIESKDTELVESELEIVELVLMVNGLLGIIDDDDNTMSEVDSGMDDDFVVVELVLEDVASKEDSIEDIVERVSVDDGCGEEIFELLDDTEDWVVDVELIVIVTELVDDWTFEVEIEGVFTEELMIIEVEEVAVVELELGSNTGQYEPSVFK